MSHLSGPASIGLLSPGTLEYLLESLVREHTDLEDHKFCYKLSIVMYLGCMLFFCRMRMRLCLIYLSISVPRVLRPILL